MSAMVTGIAGLLPTGKTKGKVPQIMMQNYSMQFTIMHYVMF